MGLAHPRSGFGIVQESAVTRPGSALKSVQEIGAGIAIRIGAVTEPEPAKIPAPPLRREPHCSRLFQKDLVEGPRPP
ncbi:hypothetical protein LOM8899_03476 [Flavimaricola marinus]|uniref:Uncharacterized protein n=1 Tax=Flavimaricola marinus TaxID=1819565 RepID=A0A238LI33_9RHOB|nr:hypothetical protein LOM8899_03476 [Flavimaricola marinus]